MKISLVIPAYNEEKYIGACLESVIAIRTEDLIEIIVVDNNSTDGTIALAEKFPGVRVVKELAKGPTHARQRGFLESKGDLVAFIDADTRVPSGWISSIQKEFSENTHLVCLSGPFHYYDLSPFKKFVAEFFWNIVASPVYWIVGFMALGANFVVKRDALVQLDGFDTSIAFYGDDTSIAMRLSKLGKVKFSMKFFIMGSGRRLEEEGIGKTFFIYGINYILIAAKKRPSSSNYRDIR
jgi:glycosyltransferase involved in cell wall biosynthesis